MLTIDVSTLTSETVILKAQHKLILNQVTTIEWRCNLASVF
jgi:hypothetical protein